MIKIPKPVWIYILCNKSISFSFRNQNLIFPLILIKAHLTPNCILKVSLLSKSFHELMKSSILKLQIIKNDPNYKPGFKFELLKKKILTTAKNEVN